MSSFDLQYSLAYGRFILVNVERKKFFFSNAKTNNCPCSCREAKKDVGTCITDLQVTYDANNIAGVRKANIRPLHGNRKAKYGSYRHRMSRVKTCLHSNLYVILYVTSTIGWSYVRLFYVAFSITLARFLSEGAAILHIEHLK